MCEFHEDDPRSATPGNARDLVNELVVALTNARVYSPDHPRVRDAVEELARSLQAHLHAMSTEKILIGVADGYLFVDERPIYGASRSAGRLLEVLDAIGSGGIGLSRGASGDDFLSLARLLGRNRVEELSVDEANHDLLEAGCARIRILGPYGKGGTDAERDFATDLLGRDREEPASGGSALDVPFHLYQNVFDHLTEVLVAVIRGQGFRFEQTHHYVEAILRNLQNDAKSMLAVSHYDVTRADLFQFRHSIRVACIALDFARRLTDDERLLQRVGAAALLHDVGKVEVSGEILHARGRLSDEQREEMSTHTVKGAQILLRMVDRDPLAIAAAFGHHRCEDGMGYPATLHSAPISIGTRIVKICDVYEALTARRPYKEPLAPKKAFRIMLSMKGHFDLPLLHRFIQLNGVYPVGELVELSTGELARVDAQTDVLDRPVVVLDQTRDGDPIPVEDRVRLDLRESEEGEALRVVKVLPHDRARDRAAEALEEERRAREAMEAREADAPETKPEPKPQPDPDSSLPDSSARGSRVRESV